MTKKILLFLMKTENIKMKILRNTTNKIKKNKKNNNKKQGNSRNAIAAI